MIQDGIQWRLCYGLISFKALNTSQNIEPKPLGPRPEAPGNDGEGAKKQSNITAKALPQSRWVPV